MTLRERISRRAKENKETGLSINSHQSGGRFFRKSGKPNVRFAGVSYFKSVSVYQYMMKVNGWIFLLLIGLTYIVVNLFFALIYFFIGVDQLGGLKQVTITGKFWEAFFFSAQTLTTVGYGHLYPSSLTANSIAAFESLTGVLMFAIATGLMYGRFSQPKSYILFSKKALFSPFQEGYALMFRFAPYKNHFLTDVEVKVTLVLKIPDDSGVQKNSFYNLNLELSKANSLISNWTIVHKITEESPLYGLMKKDMEEAQAELLIFVTGYDEEYANTVIARSSYLSSELVYGARFDMMYEPSSDQKTTILHLDKIDSYQAATLPVNLQ
jgi:inward rectifier potassium channel